jgi:MFS family permease
MGSEEMLAVGSAVVSSSFGVLAWSALSMLFFKRNDARWQRICWAICGVFGVIASPCILGWIAWISSEGAGSGESWIFLIFWSMFGVALASAIVGFRYSASAHRALQHPPTEEDRSLIG